MKFCTRPHIHLLLDHYNGGVWTCPWAKKEAAYMGNIFETPLEELWSREYELRKRTMQGDFSLCRFEACPYLQNDSLPEADEDTLKEKKFASYPTMVNIAYDRVCNQYCETCRKAPFSAPEGYPELMEKYKNIILPFVNNANFISLSGHGDPFASPYMLRLMEEIRPVHDNYTVLLETNGVFLNEKTWSKVEHLSKYTINMAITINSFDPFIYKQISRGGNYELLMQNLDFASELRKSSKIKKLNFNMVVQDKNFREMPSFIQTCLDRYCFDQVHLRPVYQWGTMSDEVFWFKDVLNPMHPYHAEYLELLDHPLLSHEKVYNFGGRTVHKAVPYPCKCE